MDGTNFTRRHFLQSTVLAVGVSLLAACSQQPTAATTSGTKTATTAGTAPANQVTQKQTATPATAASNGPIQGTIAWWAWGNADTGFKGWNEQIGIYNKKYPNVKVNLQPEAGFDKIAVTIAAGTAADMFFINVPSGWGFIGHGGILDLQPYIRADKTWTDDLSKFAKMTIDSYTYKEDLYGIPESLETSGTIYNEDMLTAKGLKTPKELGDKWDWTTFMEYAKELTSPGPESPDKVWGAYVSPDPQSGLGDFAYELVSGTNHTWLNDDLTTTGIGSSEFTQASEFLKSFFTNKVAPTPSFLTGNSAAASSAYALFDNEKVAMMVSGDWAFGWILTRQLPDKKFKMDWMTSPRAANGQTTAVGHSVANAAYAKTKNRDAVIAFLRMYSGKDMQEVITNHWDNYPDLSPRSDAQSYFWDKKLVPNAEALKKSYDIGKPYPHTPVGDTTALVISPVNNVLNAVEDGKDRRAVADVLKSLATKINGDLAKAAQNTKG